MKKITLFFAALVVAFSASAWNGGFELGTFNPTTKVFTTNVNPTQIVNFNPSCLTFAILVYNADALAALDANPTYTMFLNAVRTDDRAGNLFPNANGSWGAPYENFPMMTRINDWTYLDGDTEDGVVFYICGFDLGTPEGGFGQHLQTNSVIADEDPEVRAASTNPDGWVADAEAAGLDAYIYLGDTTQAMGPVVSTCVDCLVPSNIPNIFVDDAEIVGFYNLVGQKLAGEPASGIFIVKYSNGKAVKIAK